MSEHGYNRFRIKKISKRLNTSYHHGYAVSRTEAIGMGLKIVKPSDKLENLMWELWKDFECEMKCDTVFDPMNEVMNNPAISRQLNNVPVVGVPANLPAQGQQMLLQAMLSQIKTTNQTAFQLQLLLGCIESCKLGYNVNMQLNILAWRDFGMQICFNLTNSSDGWKKV